MGEVGTRLAQFPARSRSVCKEHFNLASNFIAHAAKDLENFLTGTTSCCWIIEHPLQPLNDSRKYWTGFPRWLTDGNYVLEWLPEERTDWLRLVIANVNTDFSHHRDRVGVKAHRRRPSTEDVEAVTGVVTQKSFRHLASTRVAVTDKQDSRFHLYLTPDLTLTSSSATSCSTRR